MAQTFTADRLSDQVCRGLVDFKLRSNELPAAVAIVVFQLPEQNIASFPAYGIFGLIYISEVIDIMRSGLRVIEREE